MLDRPARRALLSGRDLLFTPKAVAVLDYLMTHPDEVISRERLEYPIITQEIDAPSRRLEFLQRYSTRPRVKFTSSKRTTGWL